MAKREVRYCTTEDGVRIAYCVEGEGYPLVWCPVFVESFALVHVVPTLEAFIAELAQRWQVVRFDARGTGLSQRSLENFSGEALALDLAAVGRAVGASQMAVWGNTLSGPRAILYAARNPQVVTHLILHNTAAGPADAFPQEAAAGLAALARSNWKMAAQAMAGVGVTLEGNEVTRQTMGDLTIQIARLYTESAEGEVAARMIEDAYQSWDVRDLLPLIPARALVLHTMRNRLFPVAVGQEMAALIPGAKFLPLDGTGATVMADSAAENDRVSTLEAFLPVLREPSGLPTSRRRVLFRSATFRTVLFTDLVGHTEMMQRLGDQQGRTLLREYEGIARDVLRQHGGVEVKTMGDGFMASFGSVTEAVECAITLQRAIDTRNAEEGQIAPDSRPAILGSLSVRVGLNAGEPIADENDLFGTSVILASRICGQASGGEILASVAVRKLAMGKGFLFSNRGETALRGFEDPVRLYEVRWRQ